MRDLQMVYVKSGVSYVLCSAILLVCGMGLASMVLATLVRGLVQWMTCRKVYREVVPGPDQAAKPDAQILKKLWPNAYKFGVLSIGSFCLANGNVLICSQLLGKETTASFGLTAQVGGFLTSFATLWLVVKWPEIAMLRTQGRLEEMAALFARRLALVMISFGAMALIVFFAGNALLAWKGTPTRLLAPPYLALYLIYLTQNIFYVQFGFLAFTENVVPFFKIGLFTGLGVIVSSLVLTWLFGLWGLLAAPFLTEMAYSSWFTVRRGLQGQPLGLREFARAAIRGHV
jgi:O-antigen/teichoic acid export membrane protein